MFHKPKAAGIVIVEVDREFERSSQVFYFSYHSVEAVRDAVESSTRTQKPHTMMCPTVTSLRVSCMARKGRAAGNGDGSDDQGSLRFRTDSPDPSSPPPSQPPVSHGQDSEEECLQTVISAEGEGFPRRISCVSRHGPRTPDCPSTVILRSGTRYRRHWPWQMGIEIETGIQ